MKLASGSVLIREKLRELILQDGLKWNDGLIYGKPANWIFDIREVLLTPSGLRFAATALYEKLKDVDF